MLAASLRVDVEGLKVQVVCGVVEHVRDLARDVVPVQRPQGEAGRGRFAGSCMRIEEGGALAMLEREQAQRIARHRKVSARRPDGKGSPGSTLSDTGPSAS